MSLLRWLQAKKSDAGGSGGRSKPRRSFSQTTLPLISPRRGRRVLRREQLFSVVRESLIRAGVLSTSYDFKVLALDTSGDGFLVLVDLALPADAMPDEYLLEIERWIQQSAKTRHEMDIRSVYWRRKASHDQVGMALKAAVSAQTQREAALSGTAIPAPDTPLSNGRVQSSVAPEEVSAFRQALQQPAMPAHRMEPPPDAPEPESHSGFSELSETQYGKL